jgi:hypothetical protein
MKQIIFILSIVLLSFKTGKLPEGWTKVETVTIASQKADIYFFDYMSKMEVREPDYRQYKGRAFTDILQKVQFQFPTYAAKMNADKNDSVMYYLLVPNVMKADEPYYFDLRIVRVGKDFQLSNFEDSAGYSGNIVRTVPAIGCRGSLLSEHNRIIQEHPNKEKLIGNGVQITDSIFTRVIPYAESKKAFLKLIEANL